MKRIFLALIMAFSFALTFAQGVNENNMPLVNQESVFTISCNFP